MKMLKKILPIALFALVIPTAGCSDPAEPQGSLDVSAPSPDTGLPPVDARITDTSDLSDLAPLDEDAPGEPTCGNGCVGKTKGVELSGAKFEEGAERGLVAVPGAAEGRRRAGT